MCLLLNTQKIQKNIKIIYNGLLPVVAFLSVLHIILHFQVCILRLYWLYNTDIFWKIFTKWQSFHPLLKIVYEHTP